MPPRFYFPNVQMTLRFVPVLREQICQFTRSNAETFRTRYVVVKTRPFMNKLEIKQTLERLYGLKVEKVNTLNVLGKMRYLALNVRRRRADYKKAYVRLAEEVELPRDPRFPQ